MAEKTVEKATDDLDQLADEDEKLTKELATATAERKAAIEAQLQANKARAAFLSERRLSAERSPQTPGDGGRSRRRSKASRPSSKRSVRDCSNFPRDALAAGTSAPCGPRRSGRRARLSPVRACRRPSRTPWTPSSGRSRPDWIVPSSTWRWRSRRRRIRTPSPARSSMWAAFARIVADLQATVSRLLDPGGPRAPVAMAETRRTMQWALARLAGYIARLVFFRAGFTGPPK